MGGSFSQKIETSEVLEWTPRELPVWTIMSKIVWVSYSQVVNLLRNHFKLWRNSIIIYTALSFYMNSWGSYLSCKNGVLCSLFCFDDFDKNANPGKEKPYWFQGLLHDLLILLTIELIYRSQQTKSGRNFDISWHVLLKTTFSVAKKMRVKNRQNWEITRKYRRKNVEWER